MPCDRKKTPPDNQAANTLSQPLVMAREISSGETGGSRSYQLQSDDDSGKTALRLRRRHTALSELYRSPPGLEASCTEPAASCTSRRLGMAGSGVRVARTSGRWKDPSALSALSAFVCLNDRGRQRRQGRQRFCGSGDLYRSRLSPQDCSSAGLGPASERLAWLLSKNLSGMNAPPRADHCGSRKERMTDTGGKPDNDEGPCRQDREGDRTIQEYPT